jgi:predicted transcriptional regulator
MALLNSVPHQAFKLRGTFRPLARVLTGKRMELLRYVRRHHVMSVRALAKALGSDYNNGHADVQTRTASGLLDVTDGGLQAGYANRDINRAKSPGS